MEHRPNESDPVEQDALRRWGEQWEPPESLRGRTLAALKRRGLLGGAPTRPRRVAWAVALAAAAGAAFVIGMEVGGRAPSAAAPTGPLYVLLLFESSAYRPAATPDARTERVREYGAWARETSRSGRYVAGEKLAGEGRWCLMRDGKLEVLAPASDEPRGMLAGYFVVGASSYDDAVTVASGCPHLRYGGTVEVRRLEST